MTLAHLESCSDGSFRVPAERSKVRLSSFQMSDSQWFNQQLLDLMSLCVAVVDSWERLEHRPGCQCHQCSATRKMKLKVRRLQGDLHRRERGNVDRTS